MSGGPPAAVASLVREFASLVPGPELPIDALATPGSASLRSAFDVDTLALAAAATANLAAGLTTVDRDRVVATFSGRVEVDGEAMPAWADLSGYYRTGDGGFVQLHCNFPHHAAGVVRRLGCEPTRDAVRAAVLRWDADELERALIDDGMIAARLRTLEQWTRHPHGAATAGLPLVSVVRLGPGAPRPAERRLRVLDCSRVLAGPVAGQTLSAHGADVLRVGADHLPTVPIAVVGTGSGKRNADVDLLTTDGRATFGTVLDGADLWVDAYRPGAFAARGFTPDAVAPGTVVVQISAFDWIGPWAGRRGFDSIVQSTTGIVLAGSEAAGRDDPTPLPVQALDYATGLFAAATALRLVAHQASVGGTWLARLSLLRTRNRLVALGGPVPFEPAAADPPSDAFHTVDSPFGRVTVARPIGGEWSFGPQLLGSSAAVWLDRDA